MRILNETQENLLKKERQLLNDLQVKLIQFDITSEDHQILSDSIQQLDELFLLVIVGEFNAGKSAFINALLGDKLLKEGVTPTTTEINVLKYGPEASRNAINERHFVLTYPFELLVDISIVDTPGANAVMREHEEITSKFVPRSDLVLFITSADRPFTESERAFLERIRDWGKKVIIVINKTDILQNSEDLQQIVDFVADNAKSLLGITPEIFPISARLALRAKLGEPALWETSRFEALETFIRQTLDEKSRLQLKLSNPLGVAHHLTNRYLEIVKSRLQLLTDDFQMLKDVDGQLDIYHEDMQRDFDYRMADIEKTIYEMEQRGQDYFDETFRLGRVFDLVNKDRIREQFEKNVVGDVPQRIEKKVNEMIDWLVESDLRQWQAVNEHLAERRRTHQDRIVGDNSLGNFNYDRERLIDAVGRMAQDVVDTYNKEDEAKSIAQGAQEAVAASALLEVGALGMGAIIAILGATMAVDITGVLLASVMAAIGLFVIPARKRMAKNEMRQKMTELRTQLINTLRSQFEKEIQRSLHRINEAIGPYTRFVRAERNKLTEAQDTFENLLREFTRVQTAIDEMKMD